MSKADAVSANLTDAANRSAALTVVLAGKPGALSPGRNSAMEAARAHARLTGSSKKTTLNLKMSKWFSNGFILKIIKKYHIILFSWVQILSTFTKKVISNSIFYIPGSLYLSPLYTAISRSFIPEKVS